METNRIKELNKAITIKQRTDCYMNVYAIQYRVVWDVKGGLTPDALNAHA